MNPKISVVIVSWNVKDLLRACLKSLFLFYTPYDIEVIVVDNASSDGSVEMIQKEFLKVRVLAQTTNCGFAMANNIGAREARGEYLLILNPDTECRDASLIAALDVFRQDPAIAAIGPCLLNSDGTVQHSIRRFPRLSDQLAIALKLHHMFPWLRCLQRYFAEDVDYTREQDVEQIMGACMLIQRSVWDRMEGFDEDYFMWFEEVDLCYRMKAAGYRIVYTPSASVVHHGGQSFSQVLGYQKQKWFLASQRRYIKKFFPWWAKILHSVVSPVSLVEAWCVQYAKKRT